MNAAICPNGTRAQWARFERSGCNDGQISSKYGLVDIHDTDIGVDKCLSSGAEGRIRSMAFRCNNIKVAEAIQNSIPLKTYQEGRYNVSGCGFSRDTRLGLAKPDTCFPRWGFPFLIKISEPAICANGSKARLAVFGDQICEQHPTWMETVDAEFIDVCHGYGGAGSWAFWCDGQGLGMPPNPPRPIVVKTGSKLSISQPARPEYSTGFILLIISVSLLTAVVVLVGIWIWYRITIMSLTKVYIYHIC